MRVAIDATPLSVATGGIRRYVEELTGALALLYPSVEFWLVSDQEILQQRPFPANVKLACSRPQGWWNQRWWLVGLTKWLRARQIDVFHGTDFSVPYLKVTPVVLTIHDLTPFDRALQPESRRIRHRLPWIIKFRRYERILTMTQWVRQQVIERFSVNPEEVLVVPLAAPQWCCPPPRPHPVGSPYFLYVGTLEPRKNVELLFELVDELQRVQPVKLVIAGRQRSDSPKIPDRPYIEYAGPVSDEELLDLYWGAVALVFPTRIEGFGLPVLEAMACGTPVVASRIPAIQEVAGEAALLVDPGDKRSWFNALRSLLTQQQLRQELRSRGLCRAKQFSWVKTARATMEVYLAALDQYRAGYARVASKS